MNEQIEHIHDDDGAKVFCKFVTEENGELWYSGLSERE